MSYTHADDCVARLGSSRAAGPTTIDADEAAQLLQVTRNAVVQMATSGELPGTLVEMERHKWRDAPTWARVAEISGWKGFTPTTSSTTRPARKSKRATVQVWRFRRADVLQLRDKRAAEQKRREQIEEFRLVRVFAGSPAARRFDKRLPRLPRVWKPRHRASKTSRPTNKISVAANSTAKLLAWAAPASTENR